jgi:hypothetical protein
MMNGSRPSGVNAACASPLDVDAERVYRNRAGMAHQINGFGFTMRVRDRIAHRNVIRL